MYLIIGVCNTKTAPYFPNTKKGGYVVQKVLVNATYSKPIFLNHEPHASDIFNNKTSHLQVTKDRFLQIVLQYSKREQHLRREKE